MALVFGKLGVVHILDGYWQQGTGRKAYQTNTYLVPMLLDAALSSCREGLLSLKLVRIPRKFASSELTLAISAQLLPASLICLSRNSSAGVQGVFVRLFLAGGGTTGVLASSLVGTAGGATGVTCIGGWGAAETGVGAGAGAGVLEAAAPVVAVGAGVAGLADGACGC